MVRLTSLVSWLAVLVSFVGVVCAFLMYRPGGVSEALTAVLHFSSTGLASPWARVAAPVAIAATILGRMLARPRPLEPSRKVHRLEPATLTPALSLRGRGGRTIAPATASPVQGVRQEAEYLRRRLDTMLRGNTDIVALVDEMLAGAIRCRASDLHLQPREGFALLALRLEGELMDLTSIAETQYVQVVRRLKVLAHLVSYKTDQPQDGRFSLETSTLASTLGDDTSSVDVRMSVLPTRHGEKVALRLLRPGAGLFRLSELGMDAATKEAFTEILTEPQGLIVLTGPTGSGKTTTLYSALDHIHQSRDDTAHLATLEDPVEIDLPFLSQTQVDRGKDLDFSAGLRALLRQDPSVLMVGEIRDAETAHIAIQAGLTGHLILTSLHAQSTTGVFTRLINMEVEPFLVASATLACVSQRLVRRLCDDCRRPARVDRKMAARLASRGLALDPGQTFFGADGCRSCEQSGLRGRLAIYEMLRITPELRHLIAAKTPTQDIEAAALAEGMTPLWKQALALAASGQISLDEALRVAG